MSNNRVRVRFAPSPTGHLHIGGLRTALFNYLFARHNNGSYLLRIEDTDLERSTDEFKNSILDSFAWIGMNSDEPVVIQSDRFAEHEKVIEKLIQEKKAYRCYCSPEDLADRLGKGGEDVFVRYDRYCFANSKTVGGTEGSFVVRFVMNENDPEIYSFDDMIRDTVTFLPDQFDDFIIVRSDGGPVYNFVVVVDDAFMKITHVIRGEEHIPNTPKQIALYKACGYAIPRFAHLPMILGPGGAKLSKRTGAKSVYEYKHEGYLPDALVNYLARLGWSHGDQEIFTRPELVLAFSLEQVGKKGAIFDTQKLDWINGLYIRSCTSTDLVQYIASAMDERFFDAMNLWSPEIICTVIDLFKERVTTIIQLMSDLKIFYDGPSADSLKNSEIQLSPAVRTVLENVIHRIQNEEWTASLLKEVALESGVRVAEIALPFRVALIGKTDGPGINDMVRVLGRVVVEKRLALLLMEHA
jgi:glutamyl-tRNA synthetase